MLKTYQRRSTSMGSTNLAHSSLLKCTQRLTKTSWSCTSLRISRMLSLGSATRLLTTTSLPKRWLCSTASISTTGLRSSCTRSGQSKQIWNNNKVYSNLLHKIRQFSLAIKLSLRQCTRPCLWWSFANGIGKRSKQGDHPQSQRPILTLTRVKSLTRSMLFTKTRKRTFVMKLTRKLYRMSFNFLSGFLLSKICTSFGTIRSRERGTTNAKLIRRSRILSYGALWPKNRYRNW